MSHLAVWVHTPFAQALGWTLVHFLWEGAILAAVLMAALWLYRPAPARRRYAMACAILAAMPLTFGATLAVMWVLQPAPIPWTPPAGQLAPVWPASSLVPLAVPAPRFTLAGILDRLAWLAPFWIVGVLFFYVRGVVGWAAVERLRRRGVCAPPPEWQVRLNELVARLRLARPVVLLESCFADTPVLIGYLRPVVLLPLGCLTGLSAGQVECILLHELAHVGRHDYLVNLLQSVVEGLLFYHPAVWWASRVVRAERENCCDDTVVEMTGDARSYAVTLAALEQRRALAPQAALAATGGNLMKRIRRLTMEPNRAHTSVLPAASAAMLLVIFAAGLTALPEKLPMGRRPRIALPVAGVVLYAAPQSAAARAQERGPAMATPYQKWLHEDVAYIITDSERAEFRNLRSDVEREAFIEQFWKRRDPTPDTVENEFKEEHYRRIAYSNEHFGDSAGLPGWKTDRGRIYITYGPPDEIDDHSSGGAYRRPPEEGGGAVQTYPFQQWRYRYIEGVGENVIVEFVDSTGSGEFHMTMDPAEKQKLPEPQANPPKGDQAAKVFVSHEGPAVSVIVPGRTQPGALSGVIGAGDVLDVTYTERGVKPAETNQDLVNLESQIAAKSGELTALLRKYQPAFPAIQVVQEQLSGLEAQRDAVARGPGSIAQPQLHYLKHDESEITAQIKASVLQVDLLQRQAAELGRQLSVSQARINASPPVIQKYNQLQEDLRLAKDAYELATGKGIDELRRKQARAKLEAAEAALAKFASGNQGQLPENSQANLLEVQTKETMIANVNQQIFANVNQQIAQEKQRQTLLEAALANNKNIQSQIEAKLQTDRRMETHITVRPDGRIAVGNAGDIKAAGLSPAQLEATIGPNSTIRIEQSAGQDRQVVTVLLPLGSPGEHFHVFGQVNNSAERVVQSFEEDVIGEQATAKGIPLRAGTYHLTVVVKNMATGAVRNSALEFTVE